MKTVAIILGLSALAFFSGCATPAARIEKNPEIFAKLTPTDQQTIREGKVAIGFTPEMVKLALGEPDRKMTRTDAQGTTESWSYTTYETDDGMLLYRGFYHRYYGWGDPFFPYYMSYPSRKDREYFKVVFTEGKVSSIEQQT
jgi:hypothetical protein